jgi:hypothetical protein
MAARCLLLLVLFAGCGTPSPAPQSTVEFASSDGKFVAHFPVTPHEEATPANPLIGKVEGKIYEAERDDLYYAVFYSRFSAPRSNPQGELDMGRDNAILATQAKLLSDENLEVHGYPGKEILLQHPDGTLQRIRFFLTEFELYQLMVGGPKGETMTSATDAFFASFRLLNPEKPTNAEP